MTISITQGNPASCQARSGVATRVAIAGGGYAGLACLLELRRRLPQAELHLIDPAEAHLKVTRLHETLDRPRASLEVPFSELVDRYGFTHHRAVLGRQGRFDSGELAAWARRSTVPVYAADGSESRVGFDHLVIATGARTVNVGSIDGPAFDKDALRVAEAAELLETHLWQAPADARFATVVGGGASGVQFACELAALARRRRAGTTVRLVDIHPRLLVDQPEALARYCAQRLQQEGVDYQPRTRFLGQDEGEAVVERDGGERDALISAFTLLMPGLAPHPGELACNRFGQVTHDGCPLEDIFAAGDCARFSSPGLASHTAQAAIRKGKLVAANIDRLAAGRDPLPYLFTGLGYVVSLGALDAAGWLLSRANVVTGIAAFTVKELVETQYDLFVEGLDTYVV